MCEEVEHEVDPYIGKEFATYEDTFKFNNDYAFVKGFGTMRYKG